MREKELHLKRLVKTDNNYVNLLNTHRCSYMEWCHLWTRLLDDRPKDRGDVVITPEVTLVTTLQARERLN